MAPPGKLPKTILAVTALAALGVLGNVFGVNIGYTVAFLFGSIFSIITLALFGPAWGVAASAVAASYTWVIWNHPYAIVIFTCEAAWIAVARRRGRTNLVIVDGAFWLLCGAPLVAIFYHGAMHLDVEATGIIVLKQSLNGISNALVASILLDHLPLSRWLASRPDPQGLPTAHVLFQLTTAVLVLPMLAVIVVDNHRESTVRQAEITRALAHEAVEVEGLVGAWVGRHVKAAQAIADAGLRADVRPGPELQAELARLRALFPDFHNVYVADAAARTVGFDPPRNDRGASTIGIDFSDRAYFAEIQRTRAPVVSEIFMGRGGVFAPLFSISAPILAGGALREFGLGAVDLAKLAAHLTQHGHLGGATATVTDPHGRVIVSTAPGRRPLDALAPLAPQRVIDPENDVSLFVPDAKKLVSSMEAWRSAFYVTRRPVAGTSWVLQMERPVAPLQRALYAATSRNLVLVAAFYAVSLGFATLVSRGLSGTPRTLAAISRDLPARIEDGREPEWPVSRIEEMSALVANFRHTADALRERVTTIKATNARLEDRVADRTRELVDKTRQLEALTSELEQRVAGEVAHRQRHEHLLAQQSKLAAMGEMIGAIAHQWRQPLNSLALIVQNLRDEVDAGPRSAASSVDQSVDRAMAQIRQMSTTIEDFRAFFLPDREETTFDATLAAGDVLRLLSAQLANAQITWRLLPGEAGRASQPTAEVGACAGRTIRARRNELEHVIHNLVNNAREAIVERRARDGGGGTIVVTVEPAGDRVRIEVRDDGGGVDSALMDRVFEPYVTTKLATGTGIGLYVSKLILEGHCRARLSVRNAADGAVFTVDLPRADG